MSVSFWYRIGNINKPETFQVGFSTTTDDINAFKWGDEITARDIIFQKYKNIFPAGTKYVAVRYNSNNKASLLLDDFKIKSYEAPAPKFLPYEYGFENNDLDEEEWSLVNSVTNSIIIDGSSYSFSGDYSFRFSHSTNPPQYLISPELKCNAEMRVSFQYRITNLNLLETFQVGYSTTTDDINAFTWGDEITASYLFWMKYLNTFPEGTKYVAVRYTSYNVAELSLDDFSFTKADGMKGDVNLDGSVDISDVVQMVNYILGDNSLVNVPLYGDMNDDSSVDISDVVALVNIILGGN